MSSKPFHAETSAQAATNRVIVIDDDSEVLEALCDLIALEGYRCLPYASAQAYLQATVADRPDLDSSGPICLLCDVKMPDMDGLELQAQLQELRDVPIILMSGTSGAREAATGFRAGAVDFLIKPIEPQHLIDAIERALALSGTRAMSRRRAQAIRARLAVLSDREMQVARLIASGMTHTGISLELGITERTVKFHRQRVSEKLGIVSRIELVRLLDEYSRLD